MQDSFDDPIPVAGDGLTALEAPVTRPKAPAQSSDDEHDVVIRLRGVVKRFGSKTVLDGINLDIRRGETTVILGGSGSGKSTLLRLMIGSFLPDEGSIEILGTDITRVDEDSRNELRKRIGILFQSGALFNSMTLRENIALPLQEHTDLPEVTIRDLVTIKLEQVELREHGEKFPAQISGGMKKRAGLARALALDPEILFYDEPSAGLDPVTSAQVDQLIIAHTVKLGVTSVVVTHEMDSAFTIADRMAMLDRGKMVKVATREQMQAIRDADTPPGGEIEAMIRQFLRGDAQGPIAARREAGGFEEELLGKPEPSLSPRQSVQGTRCEPWWSWRAWVPSSGRRGDDAR